MLNVSEIKRKNLLCRDVEDLKLWRKSSSQKWKKKCRDVEDLMCTMHNLL